MVQPSLLYGLKLHLTVYSNGIQFGANTRTSLIVQNLRRAVELLTMSLCGMCVRTSVKDDFVCEAVKFCEVDTHEYHNKDGTNYYYDTEKNDYLTVDY